MIACTGDLNALACWRREMIASAAAVVALSLQTARAAAAPAIHVFRGRGCECCEAWVAHLRDQGFTVTDEVSMGTLLIKRKLELGIPEKAFSCHTGTVDGYALEGHVPAADIRRLLAERPDAAGLALPGMPYGSPGMGPEDERDAYAVLLVRRDGSLEVYTNYPAA